MSPPVTRCHKLQSFGSAALRALIVRRRRFLLAHQIIKQWKVPNDFLSTSPDHRLARSRVNSHVVVPSAVNFSISVIAEPAGTACLQPGELLNPICPAGFQLHLPTRGIELVAFWWLFGARLVIEGNSSNFLWFRSFLTPSCLPTLDADDRVHINQMLRLARSRTPFELQNVHSCKQQFPDAQMVGAWKLEAQRNTAVIYVLFH